MQGGGVEPLRMPEGQERADRPGRIEERPYLIELQSGGEEVLFVIAGATWNGRSGPPRSLAPSSLHAFQEPSRDDAPRWQRSRRWHWHRSNEREELQ